jgi:formylglycine-generating enzyme required for sulfatase activity
MSDQKTIKFKIMNRHWSKLDDFGIQVEDDSGHWFILRITLPDDETRFLNHPFKTFNEVIAAIVEYLTMIRTRNIKLEKTEIEARREDLSKGEEVSKDLRDKLQMLGAYISIIGTPVSIGLGLASLSENDSHDKDRERPEQKQKHKPKDVIQAPKGGYELVQIPGGEFLMGSPAFEKARQADEGPQHLVRVPDFYMGRYPVTNEEYGRYLAENKGKAEPKVWRDRKYNQPRQPVVDVSWEDAKQYARWAGLQLPSEAQWEYACRVGSETRYYGGNTEADLCRVGWYKENSDHKPHPVGEKDPNDFGLYDMHGNVWEWSEDDWHSDFKGAPNDGSAWIDEPRSTFRVLRGGSWYHDAESCQTSIRGSHGPVLRFSYVGFRLALLPGQ